MPTAFSSSFKVSLLAGLARVGAAGCHHGPWIRGETACSGGILPAAPNARSAFRERTTRSGTERKPGRLYKRLHMLALHVTIVSIHSNVPIHDTSSTFLLRHKCLPSSTNDNVSHAVKMSSQPRCRKLHQVGLSPCFPKRSGHQHGAAQHDRPGALSAGSLFEALCQRRIAEPLVHVTRSSLGLVITSTTRCCAAVRHQYLSRAYDCSAHLL